jgi:hypothetical protein
MTAKQARALSRASLGYAATVANLTPDERERVERGAISLAKLHRQPRSLGDAELDRVIARVGVERTWQALLRALPQN